MTAAQINAAANATHDLLELTLDGGPLAPTTSPIEMEIGWQNLNVTLRAVAAGTGEDVNVRIEIDPDGERAGIQARYWTGYGMSNWQDTDLDDIAERGLAATR